MKNLFKKDWLLILIIILAAILRFYRLESYPALNADEASNGYDAYSLIQTGMDQHGRSWPITFQSFNDYKPGLYVYIILPFVKIFGLNEWSVRTPGAIFGVLSVLLIYFLVKELFANKKFAVISALFLAISPWHIHFSRGGWEVNTATFFVLAGILFFIKSFNEIRTKQKIVKLIISSVFLAASLYAYHAARIIVPLLGLSVLIIYGKSILKNIKPYIIFCVLTVFLLIPLAINLLSPGALSRATGVGFFGDLGPINRIEEQRGEHSNLNSISGKLMHNKIVNYGLLFAKNYASHFNGEFLFMSGDSIERNKVPETGEMYLIDILFLAVGFVFLSKKFSNSWKFVISWLIIAPIASSLTFQSPNALRSQNMVIPLVIISAFGLYKIVEWLNGRMVKWFKITGFLVLGVLVIWSFLRYLNMYYLHMSKIYPFSSQYGVGELVSYISDNQSNYKDIFVTTRYDQPYILFLYYMKYSPQMFQGHHTLTSRDQYGFSTVADFDKYHFGSIDFDSMKNDYPGSLIIGTPEEIPDTANIIKRIYGTNGFEYFDIVAN